VLNGMGCDRSSHDDQVNVESDEFGRERGQVIRPSVRPAVFDGDVLTLDVPQLLT
jgi:hypothetical protein